MYFIGPDQVRIQDLVKGGAPASEAENCRHSEAASHGRSEPLAAGDQGPLKGPGSFWGFNGQICILLHSRDSFSLILTASSTPKIVHYIVFYIFMKIVSLIV